MKFRIETPLDANTPAACRKAHGTIVTSADEIPHDTDPPCRCRLVPVGQNDIINYKETLQAIEALTKGKAGTVGLANQIHGLASNALELGTDPLPTTLGEQWRMLIRLLDKMRAGDLDVVRRGWSMNDNYRALAARVLSMDDIGFPAALELPLTTKPGWQQAEPIPGDLSPETDAALCAEVCRRVPGMTAEVWQGLDERARIGWLRNALEERTNNL